MFSRSYVKCPGEGANTPAETPVSVASTALAEGEATQNPTQSLPDDLARVVEAWPTLPDAVKAGVLAMVRASGG